MSQLTTADAANGVRFGYEDGETVLFWKHNPSSDDAAGRSLDPGRWQRAFDHLMGQIAGRFVRVEPRRHARTLVLGLLAELPRKNCWSIAERLGQSTPAGLQHLLSRAVWDQDAVRDDVRGYVVANLGDAGGGLGP